MHIKYSFLIGLASLAALFTSCSNQDAEFNNKPGEVTFVSGLNKYTTRLSDDGSKWNAGDQIGIYMVETGTTNALNYTNVLYKAETSAQTTAFKAGETPVYYPADGTNVDFIAYYPYSATITDWTYPVNLADQSTSLTAHDLLYAASNNEGKGFTEGSISFGFTHQLSKITLNLVDEEGKVLTPDANGVTIKGMNTTASFDLKSGALSNVANTADITAYKSENSSEAVLLPFTVASGHETTVMVDGKQYLWKMDSKFAGMEFKAGYAYTFKITVNVSDSYLEPVLVDYKGNSISPWEDGGDDNKEPEIIPDLPIPGDFEKITLATGESISSALGGATGAKVAIILADGGSYNENSGFSVPASISSLMLVGESGTTAPSVYFGGAMMLSGDMDLIKLYNINLNGRYDASYLMNQTAKVTVGEISIETCTVHDLRGIVRLRSASTVNSFEITNSIVYNINTYHLLVTEDDSSAPSIKLTKSTLYKLAGRGFHLDKASTPSTIIIDECTFNYGPHYAIAQFNKTIGGSLTFTNNIVGLPFSDRGVSARSEGEMALESNNFYVSDTKWHNDISTGTDCGYTTDELFAKPEIGNYKQTKLEAGDPRWYK